MAITKILPVRGQLKRLLRLCCQSAKDRIFQYDRYAAVNRLHTEQG